MLVTTAAASSAESPTPPPTVILVHGFKDTARKLEHMARHLRGGGWQVHAVTLSPSWGQAGVDELAVQLKTYVQQNLPTNAKFDLVGFSMGGLVCRYYVQRLGGAERVDRLVTLSTPHHGTWMAYLLGNVGARQMRPGSKFLADLNADPASLGRVRVTSIWTPLDLMILPPSSSVLPGARDVRIWMPAHPLMVFAPSCFRAVASALRSD